MRVIFLDVDGVIDAPKKHNYLALDKVEHLVKACDLTGSRVVISSHWRLMQPLHSRLNAVLRYVGVEVIGSTPIHVPSKPERPCEIIEWLHAFNEAASELGRPHVTEFVVIDDRDLLSEVAGEQLVGRFIRTPTSTGLSHAHVNQIVELFRVAAEAVEGGGDLPAIPGLPAGAADRSAVAVPRGDFGEVRLKKGSEKLLMTAPVPLHRYTCTLATTCAWSGARIEVGDRDGRKKRPVPWIVADPNKGKSRAMSSAASYVLTGRIGRHEKLVPIPAAASDAAPPPQESSADGAGADGASFRQGSAALRAWLSSTVVLGGKLGAGAFGTVYLGYLVDDSHRSAVAVKRAATDENIRREARLLRRLSHPHITQLVASFEDEASDHLYLVLELCEGPDLHELLEARGALTEAETRRLFAQLVDALCYLRQQSIIHRDVKPANLMLKGALADLHASPLTHAHLKLLDFGFAKCLDGLADSRHAGTAFRSVNWFGSPSRYGAGGSRHGAGGSRHGAGGSRHGAGGSRHGAGGSRHGAGGSRHGAPSPSRHSGSRHGGNSQHARDHFYNLFNSPCNACQDTAPVHPHSPGADQDDASRPAPAITPAAEPNTTPARMPPAGDDGNDGNDGSGGLSGVVAFEASSRPLSGGEGGGSVYGSSPPLSGGEGGGSVHGISVHAGGAVNVSPVGNRLYSDRRLLEANGLSLQGGKLQMTREEALQLDAYSLGRILRYMLTGARPDQTIMEAISQEQHASCAGCLLAPLRGRHRPPRCILEPSQLSAASQAILKIFTKDAKSRLTVVDMRAHEWLCDDSMHGAGHYILESLHAGQSWTADGHRTSKVAPQPAEGEGAAEASERAS